jgi:hypothetical protein
MITAVSVVATIPDSVPGTERYSPEIALSQGRPGGNGGRTAIAAATLAGHLDRRST